MNRSTVIITAADSQYFECARSCIDSVNQYRAMPQYSLAMFDLGCTSEQRQWLQANVDILCEPQWAFDFPNRDDKPSFLRGLLARPFLREYFPGFEIYLWLDADAWVQDWQAIELFREGASSRRGLAVVPEIDRCSLRQYGGLPEFWEATAGWYAAVFGNEVAQRLCSFPMLNAGVFALHNQAPHWKLWEESIRQALQSRCSLMTDQLAMNYVVYTRGVFEQTEMLPAWCNWTCHNGFPKWDERRACLVEPYLPHTRIGIMHLTTRDKSPIRRITTTANRELDVRVMYPPGLIAAPTITELDVTDHEALYHQGRSLLLARKPDEARVILERAVVRLPRHHDAIHLLGIACFELNQLDRSLLLMRQSLDLAPDRQDFWSDYVIALARLPDRAGEMLQVAQQTLSRFPQLEAIWELVAIYFEHKRDRAQLKHVLEQAALAVPENTAIQLKLARCYQDSGELERAVCVLSMVRSRQPRNVEALQLLGSLLYQQGKISLACECWERERSLNPEDVSVLSQLMVGRRQYCDWREFDELMRRVRVASESRLESGASPFESAVTSVSTFMDSQHNYRVAQYWADDVARTIRESRPADAPMAAAKPAGRITVGYLSDELRDHPTGLLMRSFFKLHERERFRIINYFDHRPDEGDPIFRQIRADVEESRYVSELDDRELSKLIRQDNVDILVGLKGWREPTRMAVFAMRPAPINVSFLGFPGTTGADFMDYIVADQVVIPPEEVHAYAEKPAYLGQCYQVTDGTALAYEELCNFNGLRQDHGLPADAVVLVSFNQAYKLDPHMMRVWLSLMKAAENTVLWLLPLNETCHSNLQRLAAEFGVESARLIFARWADHDVHMARLTHADLALDTLIYNGHTTTSEALWCRVPVVTLEGKHFASRVSASILREAGLAELITHSLDDYHKLALNLIEDVSKREELRGKLTTDALRATLFNTRLFVRRLEDLFEQMHFLRTTGRSPQVLQCRLSWPIS